jgi:hypothetical protein
MGENEAVAHPVKRRAEKNAAVKVALIKSSKDFI